MGKEMPKLEKKQPSTDAVETGRADQHEATRREAMLKLAGYASCVAPGMLVLMSGKSKAMPSCDSPAWTNGKGFSRNGHSGC